jgi:hypothetical protein
MTSRRFNIGDLVITREGISDVANGRKTIGQVCQKITSILEQAIEKAAPHQPILYSYSAHGMANHNESTLTPAKDAKKTVMTILAARMQDVAGMEVPE